MFYFATRCDAVNRDLLILVFVSLTEGAVEFHCVFRRKDIRRKVKAVPITGREGT
jgi:hypothetical protein